MLSRLKTVIALLRNPKVSRLPKFLVVAAILYIIWPFDLVPDVAPVVGWLDDIMFLIGALGLLFGSAPKAPQGGGEIIDVTPIPPGPKAPR